MMLFFSCCCCCCVQPCAIRRWKSGKKKIKDMKYKISLLFGICLEVNKYRLIPIAVDIIESSQKIGQILCHRHFFFFNRPENEHSITTSFNIRYNLKRQLYVSFFCLWKFSRNLWLNFAWHFKLQKWRHFRLLSFFANDSYHIIFEIFLVH